ncbi:hypothetical protein ACMDCR_05870 [Labrys okinawensis]|uniref:hypothetical protein n=1 Tax=Labrys okinawensis TaxID=346911 RepID=UPI0039BC71E5
MSADDIRRFTDAAAKQPPSPSSDWTDCVHLLDRLAMFDIIPAMASVDRQKIELIMGKAWGMFSTFGALLIASAPTLGGDMTPAALTMTIAYRRLYFAYTVLYKREIAYLDIPPEQVNDGRVYLGCTPMSDAGIRHEIDSAIARAQDALAKGTVLTMWSQSLPAGDWQANDEVNFKLPKVGADACCGSIRLAWLLTTEARQRPNGSLISNLAAAQHYLRARRQVCTAILSAGQMDILTTEYDNQKRRDIAAGKPNRQAGTANPVFPPDFQMRDWAIKGSKDGEADRQRCNAAKSPPLWRKIDEIYPTGSVEGGVGTA